MKENNNSVSAKNRKVLLHSSDKGVVMKDVKGTVVLICDVDGYGAYGLWCGTPDTATRLVYEWAKEHGLVQPYEHLSVDFYNQHGDDITSATKPGYGSFAAGLK
jgi:hypothetical protein